MAMGFGRCLAAGAEGGSQVEVAEAVAGGEVLDVGVLGRAALALELGEDGY
jgi:hypothetical protein